MPHDHHSHSHARGGNARALGAALGLTSVFLIAEVVAGFAFNSLALLSDAAHMLTDTAALAIALAAVRIGERAADDSRTFGYRRFEILAAAFNAVLLFGVALYVFVEAVQRLLAPEPVRTAGMLVVAAVGLGVNFLALRLLAGGKDTNLNVKGAYLEVWSDLIGSAGVIVGALLMLITGWRWVDPVVAVGIALWVLPRMWVLLRDSTSILLEAAPRGMVVAEIRRTILQCPDVAGVHDLHVWTSGADQPSCSAHVEVGGGADYDNVRVLIAARLNETFGLRHLTLQLEHEACRERELLHA